VNPAAPISPEPTSPAPTSPAPTSPEPTSPAPVPGGPASSGPATIPVSALLQASDIGAGYRADPDPEGDDHGALDFILRYCEAASPLPADSLANRSTYIGRNDDHAVLQHAKRFRAGEAATAVQQLRGLFAGQCAATDNAGNPNDRSRFTVLDAGPALLVREVRTNAGSTTTTYRIAIAVGDVFTEIRTIGPDLDEAAARAIAQRAARRLCAAAPGVC
jgi:hypothetical protein